MKSSSLVYPENPMNGLEAEPVVLIVQLASLGQLNGIKDMLKQKDYDLDERTDLGYTAALQAAIRNDLEMLKFLAEKGARLDIASYTGCTVLGWAQKYKNAEMVRFVEQELAKYSVSQSPRP